MGRLMSFLGGAARSLQGSIEQDRLEQKRIEDEQRQHTQQVSWAKAANAIRIAQEQASRPPDQRASGMPFPVGPGGFQQATEVATPVRFDNDGNVIEAAGWKPGPSVAVPDPNALDPYKAAMLEQKQLDRDARIEAAKIRGSRGGSSRTEVGEDGLTAYQREQLKRTDAREERLSNQSGKGSGGMTEKGWREGMDATLNSIQGAEAGKLKTIIRQYGGDNQVIMPGSDPEQDLESLRETAFAVAETYWNERKPGKPAKSQGEKPGNSAGLLSAPPAAVAELKADPSPEAKRDFDEVFGEGAADRALGRR